MAQIYWVEQIPVISCLAHEDVPCAIFQAVSPGGLISAPSLTFKCPELQCEDLMTQSSQEQTFKWWRAVDFSELIGKHRMTAHHGGAVMYFGHLLQHLACANEHSYWQSSRCRSRAWDTQTRWRRVLHGTWACSADAATDFPENKHSYSRFSDLSLYAKRASYLAIA